MAAAFAFSRKLSRKLSKRLSSFTKKDHEETLDVKSRYKPEGLQALCCNTKFSRKELQLMYRGFKQQCPAGHVDEGTIKDIYAQFFPQGDSSYYAHHVFRAFDKQKKGSLSFEEFVSALSVLARGTLHDKAHWAFSLYDVNGDGIITREEMGDVVAAIYDMMGRCAQPVIDEHTVTDHVDRVFTQMDKNQDGVITLDEFLYTCQVDQHIRLSLAMFDTVL